MQSSEKPKSYISANRPQLHVKVHDSKMRRTLTSVACLEELLSESLFPPKTLSFGNKLEMFGRNARCHQTRHTNTNTSHQLSQAQW